MPNACVYPVSQNRFAASCHELQAGSLCSPEREPDFARDDDVLHRELISRGESSSIIAVLGIRLIRRNCTYCSEPYQPEAAVLRAVPEDLAANTKFLRGAGCTMECLFRHSTPSRIFWSTLP